jgi:type 1 glutamine amidotransferase
MKTSLLQRSMFISTAAAIACLATTYVAGQAPQSAPPTPPAGQGTVQAPPAAGAQVPAVPGAPGPGARAGGGGRGRGPGQWGGGPIRVMVVTKGHNFNPREEFYAMWDSLGADITWTSVEHPAADVLLSPKYSDLFDVYAFYDLGGPGVNVPRAGGPGPAPVIPKGAAIAATNAGGERYYPQPSPEFKSEFAKLLKQGDKGFVFLHHANAAWAHVWPEYSEVVGSACDWYAKTTVRGIDHPQMGYFGNTPQKLTVVDKDHPITKGLEDFELSDEAYNCHMFEDSVHALVRTSFVPPNPAQHLNPKVAFSNLSAYVKVAENSPVFYTQMGHGAGAWGSPGYRQMLANAIKWAASPEAKAWAKANPKKIFK